MTVAPSPFNAVKRDLGLILILLPLAWLIIHRLVEEPAAQAGWLAAFSLVAGVWLLGRAWWVRRREREAS
jgi:thiol:disulfide interchange protein